MSRDDLPGRHGEEFRTAETPASKLRPDKARQPIPIALPIDQLRLPRK